MSAFLIRREGMHSRLLRLFLLLLVLPALGLPISASQSAQDIQAEEYAVYDAVLSDVYLRYGTTRRIDSLVIKGLTQSHVIEIFDFEGGKREAPALLDETVADLKSKSKQAYQLRDAFTVPIKRVLLSQGDSAGITTGRLADREAFWGRFHKTYPNSSGVVGLSRVGFNGRGDQALVHFHAMCGTLCGQSYFVLLAKDQKGWSVSEIFGRVTS